MPKFNEGIEMVKNLKFFLGLLLIFIGVSLLVGLSGLPLIAKAWIIAVLLTVVNIVALINLPDR